jgi:hypothetical protein
MQGCPVKKLAGTNHNFLRTQVSKRMASEIKYDYQEFQNHANFPFIPESKSIASGD